MADKRIRKTLDDLRGDIQELAESFAEFRSHVATERAFAAAEKQNGSKVAARNVALDTDPLPTDEAGSIDGKGAFNTGQETYHWTLEHMPIEDLLAIPMDTHPQMLAAIGHQQRMGILLMLLSGPATALDVVEGLTLGTTGAAYHHLNVLQSARIVEQRKRGTFSIVPEQVPVILTILAALSGGIALEVTTPAVEMAEDESEEAAKDGKGKTGKK